METRHISAHIYRPAQDVYDFASDPRNLPRWAPGLCSSVERVNGEWVLQSPLGRVVVTFAERNHLGILDHNVTLPNGDVIYNPMRVVAADDGCEVVFSLRRRAGVTDDDFDRDARAVLSDLTSLKEVMESRP